jgi:hypothetical protein
MLKNIIILILPLVYGCTFFIKERNIKGIKISQVFPYMSNEGKLINYDTPSVKIYYYKNYTLYHLVYHFDSSVNSKLLLSEDRYHNVVYMNGEDYAYDYDEHKYPYKRKVSIDSIFNLEWVFRIQVYSIFTNSTAILISSDKDNNSGILREVYKIRGNVDTSLSSTCYLEFSNKSRDVNFSLSKELDSIKKMSLFKIRNINNPRYFKQAGIYIDRVETSYLLEEIKVPEDKRILYYFKMYEKDQP